MWASLALFGPCYTCTQSLVIPGYVGSSSSPWWLSYHLQLLDKFLASPPVLCLSEPSLKPQINGEDAPPCLLATEIISSTDSAPNKLCPLQHQWWSYWFSWHWQSWGKGNGVWAAIDSWFSYPKLGSFNKYVFLSCCMPLVEFQSVKCFVCLLVWLGLVFVSANWPPFKYFFISSVKHMDLCPQYDKHLYATLQHVYQLCCPLTTN